MPLSTQIITYAQNSRVRFCDDILQAANSSGFTELTIAFSQASAELVNSLDASRQELLKTQNTIAQLKAIRTMLSGDGTAVRAKLEAAAKGAPPALIEEVKLIKEGERQAFKSEVNSAMYRTSDMDDPEEPRGNNHYEKIPGESHFIIPPDAHGLAFLLLQDRSVMYHRKLAIVKEVLGVEIERFKTQSIAMLERPVDARSTGRRSIAERFEEVAGNVASQGEKKLVGKADRESEKFKRQAAQLTDFNSHIKDWKSAIDTAEKEALAATHFDKQKAAEWVDSVQTGKSHSLRL